MKKRIIFLSLSILCCIFTSCANTTVPSTSNDASKTVNVPESGGGGFTVNKIAFETLKEDDIPKTLKAKTSKVQKQRGYVFEEMDGYYYVAILSGEKPTAGYGIRVLSVEDNEGRTNIKVEEVIPNQDDASAQVLTYPYTVIKIKGVMSNFIIKSTKGELFSAIK